MELSTVEIPRAGARERAAEYRRAAKTLSDPAAAAEFADIARAYEAAARDDVALIALSSTIRAGGVVTRTITEKTWTNDWANVGDYAVPALAVAPWQAAFVYTLGVESDGSVAFLDSIGRSYRYERGLLHVDARFELAERYTPARRIRADRRSAWTAMVPIVPPKHRPARGMGDRLVLFEAEEWTWSTVPAPPGDPALLRPLGGDLYAVDAVWDLTPLEQIVLAGRTR